jgi:ribosome-binding factor A
MSPVESPQAMMKRSRRDTAPGPSQRQLRVGELIRRTLSDVLTRAEVHDPDLNRRSITVGEVRVSPDLRVAKAFVMPLGGGERAETLQALERNRAELRHHLGRALSLKYVPDLRFVLDDSFDRMEATERLLNSPDVRRDLDHE